MAGYLTDAEIAQIADARYKIFDTISRDIKVIRRGRMAVINSDVNFNFVFPGHSPELVEEEIIEATIKAKIRYDKQALALVTPDSLDSSSAKSNEIKLKLEEGKATITVRQAGYDVLNGCDHIQMDGNDFVVDGSPVPKFNFGAKLYGFNLKRVNKNGQG